MLFGWVPRDATADVARVVTSMRRALLPAAAFAADAASAPREGGSHKAGLAEWALPGFGIGIIDQAPLDRETLTSLEAATVDRHSLWMAGEAFDWPSQGGAVAASHSRTPAFRRRVLEAILSRGPAAIRDLDGEYQIALWDRLARRLVLLNDRFGGLPLYWTRTADGFAFAGGVRGVLLAPGARAVPDPDAIREAVTFGGFRLGDRTNVLDVRMMAGASALTWDGASATSAPYWRWADIPVLPAAPVEDVIGALRTEWRRAVTARLEGSGRPALTLSGGLDSRAILAEASQHARIRAVTYGVPESDDVRIARKAARAAGASWTLHPLYSGENPDWLERRTSHIQGTDGLMDLVDLMHLEALDTLTATGDLDLSGYIGDAVTGPTFNAVRTAEDVAIALPYYGGRLAMRWEDAVDRAGAMVQALDGAPPRFALFAEKLPQSTNRITAALRPYVRVRRPFVDYRVFELAQGQPDTIRGAGLLHDRWLRTTYPACFARIPHQKTGVPPLSPPWRRLVTRAARYGWRRGLSALAGLELPVSVPRRSFQADEVHWRRPGARARIEETILRADSISCAVFGREAVTATVRDWFERLAAPVQVIGALYVYEAYHRDLAADVQRARHTEDGCSSAVH